MVDGILLLDTPRSSIFRGCSSLFMLPGDNGRIYLESWRQKPKDSEEDGAGDASYEASCSEVDV
jgi:hypothetical protein